MRKILDFISSLFNPNGLRRYRHMMVFATVLIFILEAYILFLPVNAALKANISGYTNSDSITRPYYNVSDEMNVGVDGIKLSAYYIENNTMYSKVENEEIVKYKYTFNLDGKLYKMYFVFDVNDYVDKKIKEYSEMYGEAYPDDEDLKKVYVGTLAYVQSLNGTDANDVFEAYHATSTEDIGTILEQYDNHTLYEVENDSYIALFNANAYAYVFPKDQGESIYENVYDEVSLDITKVENINDFSKPFARALTVRRIDSQTLIYLGRSVLTTMLYPLVFAFFAFLILRKRGCMRTFKEYYNVCALTSFVPTIVAFALTWVIGQNALYVYMLLSLVAATYFTFKINAISEINTEQTN